MGMTLSRGPCRKHLAGFFLHGVERIGKDGSGLDGKGTGMTLSRGPCRGYPARVGYPLHGGEGIGKEGTGLDWIGRERHGRDPLARAMQKAPHGMFPAWMGLERMGRDWMGRERHGHDPLAGPCRKHLTGFFLHGLERIGSEWIGPEGNGLAWAWPSREGHAESTLRDSFCMDRIGVDRVGGDGSGMGMTLSRGPCRKHLEGFFLHGKERSGGDGRGADWRGKAWA
jgi:hypothetical protein